jgi:hypothetical protein
MPTAALQSLLPRASGGVTDTAAGRPVRGGGAAQIDRLALSQVRFQRGSVPGGQAAYRGYINDMLDRRVSPTAGPGAVDDRVLTAARRESSFNPLAINLVDSNATSSTGNAADMMPNRASRGGVQTIPSTFAAFHQAGTSTNIYDPVANLCAARNYLLFDPKYRVAADGSDLGRIAQFNPRSAARGTEMSVEAFVQAAGGVMGRAREGFGAGRVACDCPLAPVRRPPAAGQGAAIDAHQSAAARLATDSQRLAQQDAAGDTQLAAAVAQSHSGRAAWTP